MSYLEGRWHQNWDSRSLKDYFTKRTKACENLNFLLFGLFPKVVIVKWLLSLFIFFFWGGGVPRIVVHTQFEYVYLLACFFSLGTFLQESVPWILNFASDWLSLWWENTKQSAAKKIMFWHLFHGFGAFLGDWDILGGRVRAVQLGGVEDRADWQDLPITVISSYPSVTGKWGKKMLANTNTKKYAKYKSRCRHICTNKDTKRLQELFVIVNFGWENTGKWKNEENIKAQKVLVGRCRSDSSPEVFVFLYFCKMLVGV